MKKHNSKKISISKVKISRLNHLEQTQIKAGTGNNCGHELGQWTSKVGDCKISKLEDLCTTTVG